VAIYEAAARLVEILKRATQLFLLPLFPIAGAVVPNQSKEETQSFYQRFFGVNLAFNAGLYLIPATMTFGILRIWLGPEMSRTAGWAFLVLSVTAFVLAVAYPAVLMLAGTGRMRLLVVAALTALSLNIFLSPVLAKYFGFRGLLAGTVFVYGGQSLIILVSLQSQKEFALHGGSFLRGTLVAVASAVLPGLIFLRIFGQELQTSRLVEIGVLNIVIYCSALLTLQENRNSAVSVILHCRKMITAWLAERTAGPISQT